MLVLAVVLVSSTLSSSSWAAPLLWAEVEADLETLHPTFAAAVADVDAAQGELLAAEGVFDPLASAKAEASTGYYKNFVGDAAIGVLTPLWGTKVEGGYRFGLGDFPTYYGAKKTNDWGEARLQLSVPLLRDGFTDARRAAIAKLNLEQFARREALRLTVLDLQRAAASAYWDWVSAGAKLQVAERLLQLALDRDDQLARRARVGDVPALEVTDNARVIASRRSRQIASRRALERAALNLAMYLRDDDGRPAPPARDRLPTLQEALVATSNTVGPLPAQDREELRRLAAEQRPELRRGRLQLRQYEVDQNLADNQLLPGLAAQGGVSQDFGPTSPPMSSSSSVWNPSPETRAYTEFKAGLSFELPVLLRAARGRRDTVIAQTTRARANLALNNDKIGLEVDDGLQAVAAAEERLGTTAAEVEAAAAVADGERLRFERGDSTLLFVNQREVAVAEAELAA
ncbi:MAG TPA: TolC family protein, partial [Myxococcota bacterium]